MLLAAYVSSPLWRELEGVRGLPDVREAVALHAIWASVFYAGLRLRVNRLGGIS